jgi:hypothetical protein
VPSHLHPPLDRPTAAAPEVRDGAPGPVERWRVGLASVVGLDPAEIEARHDALVGFCRRHRVTPQDVLRTWQSFPELTVRRRPGAVEAPDLAVESFLVHNGINVFGDLVCVPGRPEHLADQGPQFLRGREPGPGGRL